MEREEVGREEGWREGGRKGERKRGREGGGVWEGEKGREGEREEGEGGQKRGGSSSEFSTFTLAFQLPLIIHSKLKGFLAVLLSNLGFSISFCILLLVALYEDKFDDLV